MIRSIYDFHDATDIDERRNSKWNVAKESTLPFKNINLSFLILKNF